MDGRPAAAESHHLYTSHPWPNSPNGAPRITSSSTSEVSPTYLATPLDYNYLPIFSQHIYREQLLHYNKLLSAGRGGGGVLQSTPAVQVPSSPQTKSGGRPRSSSKVSNKESHPSKTNAQSCHGNRAAKTSETAERALITTGREQTSKMSAKKHSQHPPANGLPLRPAHSSTSPLAATAQSSSVPSTPHQHARKFSFSSREPSPGATQNHSPRSAYSETNGNVPSLRPLPARWCRFETAIPFSRRRMPYSMGTERLEPVEANKIKSRLGEEEEKKLNEDMMGVYQKLLPTEEVEMNRKKLVEKLEKLFNTEWPGNDIRVHLFGSSGNLLCSDDSDVDICITTPWKELEHVCLIAELLDKHGMEKVVCVSSAKVPIVKIWDPELKLACDMNVNNTLALENTRMVRTYVSIDERVRPLAMIIKYWTRRRIVNDAAFGGTLSSYTWICMIIAFLQLRKPPVLPALHQCPQKLTRDDGTPSEFADDLDQLRGFGKENGDSLASLLFQFFRFYAHEFDYDNGVLSIRHGRLLTKVEKVWHIGSSNNFLCIEEPFNIYRNLGNTADETTFRGLHLELRRAFDLLAEGKFHECCEEYVFPKEEERIFQKPASVPRPVPMRSSSQQSAGRGGRGGFRNGRQFRNGNPGRRASSSVTYDTQQFPPQVPTTMAPGEHLVWYPTHPQMTPDMMAATANALAAQQQELQFQLFTQQINRQQQQLAQAAQRIQSASATERSRTNSFDTPVAAPIRSDMLYGFSYPLHQPAYFLPGFTTYPSSPASTASPANGPAEFRRSLHRNTAASESGSSAGSGALRSQSQPASRTTMTPSQTLSPYSTSGQLHNGAAVPRLRHTNGVSVPGFVPDEAASLESDDALGKPLSDSPPEDDGSGYLGYYVSNEPSPNLKVHGTPSSGLPSGDLGQNGQGRRRLSTDQLPQSVLDRRMKRTSRSPSPLGHARAFSVGMNSAPLLSTPFQQANGKLTPKPVVANGSTPKLTSAAASARPPTVIESVVSESVNHDNPLHIHQAAGPGSPWADRPTAQPLTVSEPSPPSVQDRPVPERPVIVNGSTTATRPPPPFASLAELSFQQRVPMGYSFQNPYPTVSGDFSGIAGLSRGHSRQPLAPLDLATEAYMAGQEFPHLSPVYEHRTPSPTAVRKFEPPIATSTLPRGAPVKEGRTEPPKSTHRTPTTKSPPAGPLSRHSEAATKSPVLDQKTNGVSRENGHVRSTKSHNENTNAWQMQKPKTRKKGATDSKHMTNGYPQSEQPPKNDADRKGG